MLDMLYNADLGGNDLELPAHLFAHLMERAVASGADLLFLRQRVFNRLYGKVRKLLVPLPDSFAALVGDLF